MRPERICTLLLACALATACAAGGGATPKARKVSPEQRDAAALQVKLGQGYLTEGELETARDKLQRALELDPTSVDAHTLTAVLNERINRPDVAEQFYRRAAELKPDDGAVNNNLGAFLCGRGKFEEAEPYFQRAFKDPFYRTPALAFTNAGVCAAKTGHVDSAEVYFRQALDIDPRNAVALFELSRLHLARGDLLRARAFLQRYEVLVPTGDAEALDLGALIEERAGNAAAAEQYRQRLRREFPEYQPAAEGGQEKSSP